MKKKQDRKITDPHDSFIKKVLKSKAEAISLIKGVLPEDIKNIVRLETIRLLPDTYIDSSLKKSLSDIVYQAEGVSHLHFNLSFIIEHKSFAPKVNIKIQLMQYFLGAVQTQISQHNTPLALPVIIFLYHGEKNWQDEPLWKLFGDVPEFLRPFVPDFEFIPVIFDDYDDERVKQVFDSYKIRATVMVMRDIHKKLYFGKTFTAVLQDMPEHISINDILEFLKSLLYYVENVSEKKYQEAENVIKEISTKSKGTMNIIDVLIEKSEAKGEAKGKAEGIAEGEVKGAIFTKAETALKMIKGGVKDKDIILFTGLTREEVLLLKDLFHQYKEKAQEYIEIRDGKIERK